MTWAVAIHQGSWKSMTTQINEQQLLVEIYRPAIKTTRTHGRFESEPLLFNYCFVNSAINLDHVAKILPLRFVKFDGTIAVVPDCVISYWQGVVRGMQYEREASFNCADWVQRHNGQTATVKSGDLAGIAGTIDGAAGKRSVYLDVKMFGRTIRIKAEIGFLEVESRNDQ
jgi:hypothetical protein